MRTALVNDLYDWLRSILDFLMYNLNLNLNLFLNFHRYLYDILQYDTAMHMEHYVQDLVQTHA